MQQSSNSNVLNDFLAVNTANLLAENEPATAVSEESLNYKLGRLHEIERFLDSQYNFKFNEVTSLTEYKRIEDVEFVVMKERDYNSVLRNIINANIKCDAQRLRNLLKSDFTPKYNPFLLYFDVLPVWDESMPDYITELGGTVKTENQELWLKCFKKWIVAMTASILEDDIINHTVLILTGAQGLGKTTFFNNLIPASLRRYIMSGVPSLTDKDSQVQMSECMLMNLDELGVLNTTKLNQLKELVTKKDIRLRKAYNITIENYVRRASFCGSANEKQFLTDTTGNRRFLCFDAKDINYQHNINLDMVYAQALYLFKNGYKFYFTQDDINEINAHTDNFRVMTLEEEVLLTHMKPVPDTETATYMMTSDINKYLKKVGGVPLGNAAMQKIGKALNKNGFIRKKIKNRYKYAVEIIKH
ncbi:MAG TPA: VapE family protein [Chitinophagales bacterium]|nr:VapE family protein [Chitinophagales bacterium]